MTSATDPSTELTVWYDADCPMCTREIAAMRRLDRAGRIRFVDVRRAEDCPLDRDAMLARLHARERNGTMVSGAAAFAAMWRRIPLLRPLGVAATLPPCAWLLERLYRIFLRVRPRLQRLVARRSGSSTALHPKAHQRS